MAAIVIIGPDNALHADLRRRLLQVGYRVLDAFERESALSLLGSNPEHLVAILAALPAADAVELLAAVAVSDHLRRGRTFLLMVADPMALPASLAHVCDQLSIPVLAQPSDKRDQNAWDDMLDAVQLALRHFPDSAADAARDG